MRPSRKNSLILLLLGLLVVPLLHACSSGKTDPDKLEGTLDVVAMSEKSFLASYGNAISIHYPHVKVNVIAMPDTLKTIDQVIDWFSTTPADLYSIGFPLFYKSMVDAGTLLPLDALVKKSRLNMDDDPLGATSYLREMSGGTLFALPSSFYTSALFLNKSLFRSEGVPLPDKPMNWQEILELANRFAAPHFGLDAYWDSPGQFLVSVAEKDGLQLWDGKKMTIDSAQWREEAAEFQNLYQSGRFELTSADPFMQGKAAITLQNPSYSDYLSGKKLPFEWQMVGPPVLGSDRQTSSYLTMGGLVGIGAKSNNRQLAWEIVSYMTGSHVSVPSMDSLPLYDKPASINGVDIDPLYQSRFASYRPNNELLKPDQPIRDLAVKQFDLYLKGSQSIDDAVKHTEDDGNRIIAQLT